MPTEDVVEASLRGRILDQIAQRIVDDDLDVRAATLKAADSARREALRKNWAPHLASALARKVLQVGAEWAAEVAAELAENEEDTIQAHALGCHLEFTGGPA